MSLSYNIYSVNGTTFCLPKYYLPLNQRGLLGEGAFGKVIEVIDTRYKLPDGSSQKLVVKYIQKAFSSGPFFTNAFFREIHSLVEMKDQPTIIDLVDVIPPHDDDTIALVFPRMPYTLEQLIVQKVLNEKQKKYIMFQVFCGLNSLHSSNIMHRDLKPSNILIASDLSVKIIDLGISRDEIPKDSTTSLTQYVMTRDFRAPEVMTLLSYDRQVDLWSAACVMYYLYTGCFIFNFEAGYGTQLQRILKSFVCLPDTERGRTIKNITGSNLPLRATTTSREDEFQFNKTQLAFLPEEAADLLRKLLVLEPSHRSTAYDILHHPYFADLLPEYIGLTRQSRHCFKWDGQSRSAPTEVQKAHFHSNILTYFNPSYVCKCASKCSTLLNLCSLNFPRLPVRFKASPVNLAEAFQASTTIFLSLDFFDIPEKSAEEAFCTRYNAGEFIVPTKPGSPSPQIEFMSSHLGSVTHVAAFEYNKYSKMNFDSAPGQVVILSPFSSFLIPSVNYFHPVIYDIIDNIPKKALLFTKLASRRGKVYNMDDGLIHDVGIDINLLLLLSQNQTSSSSFTHTIAMNCSSSNALSKYGRHDASLPVIMTTFVNQQIISLFQAIFPGFLRLFCAREFYIHNIHNVPRAEGDAFFMVATSSKAALTLSKEKTLQFVAKAKASYADYYKFPEKSQEIKNRVLMQLLNSQRKEAQFYSQLIQNKEEQRLNPEIEAI